VLGPGREDETKAAKGRKMERESKGANGRKDPIIMQKKEYAG